MERVYGAHLCYGPPIEGGFYYDMWSDEQKVSIIHGYYKKKTWAAMLLEKGFYLMHILFWEKILWKYEVHYLEGFYHFANFEVFSAEVYKFWSYIL